MDERVSKEDYLDRLLKSDPDRFIRLLFHDFMNQVNVVQGYADVMLSEAEQGDHPVDAAFVREHAQVILDGSANMAAMLKAMAEYDDRRKNGNA